MSKRTKELAQRIKCFNSGTISFDEVKSWPEGELDELVSDRVLEEIELSKTVVCDQCPDHCTIEPKRRTIPQTGEVVGFHVCKEKPDGERQIIKLERFRQWRINEEKLPKKQRKKDDTPRISRQQKEINEKTLLISTLLAHHKFNMAGKEGQELNFEPIGQNEIAKQLQWSQSKVSRLLERSFPEGFWERYKLSCKSDVLVGFLKILDDNQVEIEAIA